MRQAKNSHYVITSKKVLTQKELEHLTLLLNRLKQYDVDERASVMLTVGLECGLRASEILGIHVKHFSPETQSLFIESLKGSNARELPLRYKTAARLEKYILSHFKADTWSQLDKEQRVFDISYDRLYQIWRFYTPNRDKTLHSLRHTFAVDLYSKCLDIRAVQMALGHRSIENTLVYLDFHYTQGALRKLMAKTTRRSRKPNSIRRYQDE